MNLSHTLLLVTIILLPCFSDSHDLNTSLVFKHCSERKSRPDNSPRSSTHTQILSTLFEELVSKSSITKYFKSSRSIEDENEDDSDIDPNAVSGLFQCREDVTNEDCRNCVENLVLLLETDPDRCKEAESARFQHRGCYIRYEPEHDDYDDTTNDLSKRYLLSSSSSSSGFSHKTCGEGQSGGGIDVVGFEEMRDSAFYALESEIVDSGKGFAKTSYELVQAVAQCQGDIIADACECGECVNSAVEIARDECGGAFSGEVYLDKCFLTYSYFPQGIPNTLSNQGENGDDDDDDDDSDGIDGKTVAIIIGGAAALCFIFIFLLCMKSWTKKRNDNLV